MTSAYPILLAFICSLLGATAQILFKKGTKNLKFNISIVRNYPILGGLMLYGISALLFIVALRHGELSVLYPIIATTYIWVNLMAAKLLREKMNAYKWGGTVLIMAGVILTSVLG